MLRFVLVIVFFLSTLAVLTHGVMVYKLSAVASIIAEEETPEEKPVAKEAKDFSDEKITFSDYVIRHSEVVTLYKSLLTQSFLFSKGFYDTPYNPPDPA